jgi:hypothetical protein
VYHHQLHQIRNPMPAIVYRIIEVLSPIVMSLPIGTNLGLWQLLWTLLSGRLLAQRGALIPALAASGLPPAAVRRAWAALAYGAWNVTALLTAWQTVLQQEKRWQAHRYEGYQPVAVDLVGFFRPRLKQCASKHYASQAGQALPAISLGMVAAIGSVGTQVVPVLRAVVRNPAAATSSEQALLQATLTAAQHLLQPHEVLIADRGFSVRQIQAAQVARFVVRVPKNFTARTATPPAYAGRGRRATRGTLVRPLPRTYRGRTQPATPPTRTEHWTVHGRAVRADIWENLVLPGAQTATVCQCYAIYDPAYHEPLLVVTNLPLPGAQIQTFYRERWPIEQIPLAAKQLLGAGRQFVFAQEPRQRLPELALFAGSLLMYLAATYTAQPTGFWDRAPRPTAGRLRRLLQPVGFSNSWPLTARIRQKHSVTAHLPKGVTAHRRIPAQARPG